MRTSLTPLAALLGGTIMTGIAFAAQPYKGDVTKVDAAKGKITLKHGRIAKFGMEAMTMGYRVADPALLKDVKAGDHVTFDVERSDDNYTVTKIEKAK